MIVVPDVELTLRPVAASVREARRHLSEQLSAAGFDSVLDIGALLVSELVTNAVLHARTEIRLRMQLSDSTVRVEVIDSNPAPPRPRPADEDAVTGRGLLLIDQWSTRWGVDPAPPGKVVWFELPREPAEEAED